MAYEKQTVALRLQRRYMSELVAMIKQVEDDISQVMYSGAWLDITAITDIHHVTAKQHLTDIISFANRLMYELDSKDIDIT
jgi:hypothetical protein